MPEKIDNQTFFTNNKSKGWDEPPIVVAWELSSAENIGALLRLCDNFGVEKVYIVGDATNYKISRIKRNATTSFNKIDWSFVSKNAIWESIPKEFLKIAVDTTTHSISLSKFNFNDTKETRFCFFFGNETIGLKNEIIKNCDLSIHIPLVGNSLSMNVVQSAAVILFEASRQCLA